MFSQSAPSLLYADVSPKSAIHSSTNGKRASYDSRLKDASSSPVYLRPKAFTHRRHSSLASDTTLVEDENWDDLSLLECSGVMKASDDFDDRRWARYTKGRYLHPYPQQEVPYAISYNPASLFMDKRTHELFRDLNHTGTPTFCDFSSCPPRRVLDLGCGEGWWAVSAAQHWRKHGTEVVGFDLLDLANNMWHLPSCSDSMQPNISWKRGNFLASKLPFPDNHFDLVRMANLGLSIPQSHWEHVLSEARRILTIGGRLELIDDELLFPHLPQLSQAHKHTNPDVAHPGPTRRAAIKRRTPRSPKLSSVDREWVKTSRQAQALEVIYESMLQNQFGIQPHSYVLAEGALGHVFGSNNTQKLHKFRISTPIQDSPLGSSQHRSESWASFLPPPSEPSYLIVHEDHKAPVCFQKPSSEIEDHACRGVHILLESQVALEEYIRSYQIENDESLLNEEELRDALWDYECFRRSRFNWISRPTSLDMEEPRSSRQSLFSPTKKRKEHTLSNTIPFPSHTNELHIRTIRVYVAVKEEEDPILPLLWT